MDATWKRKGNRRQAVGAGLAGIAGLAWSPTQAARGRTIIQRGIVGGGGVRFKQGEADFSVFASRVIIDGEEPGVVLGSVRWVDAAADLRMSSVQIVDYQNLELPPKQGEGRRISGIMRVSGEGEQPFVLEIVDAGEPGSERDRVALSVGATTETADETAAEGSRFRYRADGTIASGDVQAVDVEIPNADRRCRRGRQSCKRGR